MARPRKPSNVLELNGAFRKNPQRARREPDVEAGLGAAPNYFHADEIEIWDEIAYSAPVGVLSRSDRLCVEMLVPMILKLRRREMIKAGERSFMLSTLTRMGCTPADRSRVAAPAEQEETGDLFDFLAATMDGAA